MRKNPSGTRSRFASRTIVGGLSISGVAACTEPQIGEVHRGLAGDGVVISAVYGGGGNSGATLRNDFVELFNRSNAAVSLDGLSLQYGSATGVFGSTNGNIFAFPAGISIPPGGVHLVVLASGGANGTAIASGDSTSTIDLAATSGKVALARTTVSLGCGSTRCATTDIVDMFGYGTASDFEGTAATAVLSATKSAQRKLGGCVDTQDTAADFDVLTPAVAPRNSATPATPCGSPVDGGLTSDATAPDATAPDATAPDATAPDATAPDATAPDATAPDATAPDATAPDATIPLSDAGSAQDAEIQDATSVPADGGTSTLGQGLVISQIYGGGGNSGARYSHDFVELFNRTTGPLSLNGLSIQYGSSTGNFANPPPDGGMSSGITVLPDVTLQAGQYFLVQMASGGAVGDPLPATADFDGITNFSGTNGKVALARTTEPLGCGSTACPPDMFVDLIGYGTANAFEGSAAAPALDATLAAMRAGGGCTDTDDNNLDFATGTPAPRNRATTALCGSTPPDAGTADLGPRPDATDPSDASSVLQDAATSGSDATIANDAQVAIRDAGRPDSGRTAIAKGSDSSGCSCDTGSETNSRTGGLVALLALFGILRRRRSR